MAFEAQAETDTAIPMKYDEALRFMTNKPFLATTRFRGQQWRADRKDAHPDILEFERRFIRRLTKLGVPMFAHCVNRSNAEQRRLRLQGNSKAGPGESPHNYGCAVDLVHGTKAWELPKPCWDLIGHLGKEIALQAGISVQWGGEWKFYDPAHWELTRWREERAL